MFEFVFTFRFLVAILAGIGVYAIWTYIERLIQARRNRKQMEDIRNSIQIGEGTTLHGDDIRRFFAGELVIQHAVCVRIPKPLDPETRGRRFADPIDAELQKRGIGEVTGGGTMAGEYCAIDVSLNDFNEGVALLRLMLRKLDAPKGTVIEYECGEIPVHENGG